ncbi:PilW family protein [Arhodomonas aquaeolei]|uniref:PilW family protein n=1 Tax=Arhodomonas aquaeolei TaxID=2369 RepID=UPI00037DEE79|nr:PilW family protein [Arhodomonas aquaeolei]
MVMGDESHSRERGLTLIELMIALVLGLMLSAGAVQLFIANKQSYRLQDALARVQENGRFAMQRLGRDVRMAGYHNPLTAPTPDAFHTDATPSDSNTADGGSGASDRVAVVRMYPDETAADCLGTKAAGERVVNVYSVSGGSLVCRGMDPETGSWLESAQPLIDGVDTFQAEYGIDSDDDGSVDSYEDAGGVTDWSQVITVRLALLLRTQQDNLRPANADTYNVLGETVSPGSDGRLRSIFENTIVLRNRLP